MNSLSFRVIVFNYLNQQESTEYVAVQLPSTHCIIQGFAKDRKELILQYLSGLASPSPARDQSIVTNFLAALDSRGQGRDPVFYLGIIQKMKGEWYNQEGE